MRDYDDDRLYEYEREVFEKERIEKLERDELCQ